MARKGTARRPMLCGYYGEHNLGDDALLEVLLRELPATCVPLVTAHDQAWIQDRFGVDTCNRRRLAEVMARLGACDALVLGGGSLLQDATSLQSLLYYGLLMLSARLQGKPVLLWGQGLGPLRRPISRLVVRGLLPLATAISWRDRGSADLARRLGRHDHRIGSDPVWAYPQHTWRGEGGPIVLCWRPLNTLGPAEWVPYLQGLAALVEHTGRDLIWLPFHRHQDRGLLQSLDQSALVPASVLARSREVEVDAPGAAMDLFARAGLVLAMRLHGLILAALAGCPVAALSYDPKVAAVAKSLGCPLQDLEAPPHPLLVDQWLKQLDRPLPAAPLTALREGTAVHRQLLAGLGSGLDRQTLAKA